MPRQMQNRLKKFGRKFVPIFRERLHQIFVGACIAPERFACKIDILAETCCISIIERVSESDFGLNPVQFESFQRKRFEKWGAGRKRMNR